MNQKDEVVPFHLIQLDKVGPGRYFAIARWQTLIKSQGILFHYHVVYKDFLTFNVIILLTLEKSFFFFL